MPRYIIESPHEPQECLQALDEVLAQGSDVLAGYEWGCAAGNHTGWVTVERDDESSARNTVPSFLLSKARIMATNKFTPDQIRSFHQKGL